MTPAPDGAVGAPGSAPHWAHAIDWSAPWLMDGWAACGQPLTDRCLAGQALLEVLQTPPRRTVGFVDQSVLPAGVAYESFIREHQQVPTREGLHDFFNALCWQRFPRLKACLNRWQAEAIGSAEGRPAGRRGPLRDAITLLDENGALLQAPPALWQALLRRDWSALGTTLRPLWAQARLVLFGHALPEKLVHPYPGITAHVLCLPLPRVQDACDSPVDPWDDWLAETLTPDVLQQKPFTPWPVLGTPGWWPDNEQPGFYANQAVFRPARVPTVQRP